MTDEQIEDMLEYCPGIRKEDVLALIKRQRDEIKKLMDECGSQSVLWRNHYASIYETAKETIKAEARAEAIREFAERLKAETCDAHPLVLGFVREVVDSIEQELTEEQK